MLRGAAEESHSIGTPAPYPGPVADERRLESAGDPGHSDDGPRPWAPAAMPDDARSLGLDRNTVEGAWLHFAASLDGRRPAHKLVAWALLLFFGAGVLLQLRDLLPFD
jgi:hypothetical protein